MALSLETTTTTTSTVTGHITGDDIRKAFGLPSDAIVAFDVPGGGDWSNTSIDIDADNQLRVSYSCETKTSSNEGNAA